MSNAQAGSLTASHCFRLMAVRIRIAFLIHDRNQPTTVIRTTVSVALSGPRL
jgi:hypothetical protein